MRGGDSLMFWISRLNGVIWNICHSSSCIHSPTVRCPSSVFFGNGFRSADCQKIQLPLGGSRGEAEGKKPYAFTIHPTAQFRGLRADSIRPYSLGGEAAAIHRTTQLRAFREAKSLPYRTQKLSVFSVYVTGRVREPTCGYNPRASLSGGTAARPDRWLLPRNEPRSPVSCGHL